MDLSILKQELMSRDLNSVDVEFIISYAQSLLDKDIPVIFDLEHLRRLLGLKRSDFKQVYYANSNQYHNIEIPKNNGLGTRKLSLPSDKLKKVQRWILDYILYNFEVNEKATGFTLDKSIVTNANFHTNQKFVLKIDIKDFFPTITSNRVYGLFKSFGYNNSISLALTKLCTHENCLPQGAPTSPYISNLICRHLDIRLNGLAKKNNLNFSRYADDITFSGEFIPSNIVEMVQWILIEEGFWINELKTKLLNKSQRQKITGIIVNQKLSVPKEITKTLRQEIYYMKKFGVQSHLERKNLQTKTNVKEHYFGLVRFILMVDNEMGKKLSYELKKINWDS